MKVAPFEQSLRHCTRLVCDLGENLGGPETVTEYTPSQGSVKYAELPP